MRYYLIKNWMKIVLALVLVSVAMSLSVYIFTSKYKPTNSSNGLISIAIEGADKLLDYGLVEDALAIYQQIQKFISPDTQPVICGYVKIKEGVCYSTYAEKIDKEKNILTAIDAYKDAIKICPIEKCPHYYAMAQQYLGDSYYLYSVYNGEEVNLNSALRSYGESHRIFTITNNPHKFGLISFQIGNVHVALSKYNKQNLLNALTSYKDALKTFRLETNPFEYALIHERIGTVYLKLAMETPSKENFEKAIESYQESLTVDVLKEDATEYLTAINNLASTYYSFAQVENPEAYLKSAIRNICKALYDLSILNAFNRREEFYATLQANLGAAHHQLSYYSRNISNLKKSIRAYQKALSVYKKNECPDEYKMIQTEIGNAYSEIARIIPSVKNFKKANAAYNEVIKTSVYKYFPLLITNLDGYNRTPLTQYVKNNINKDNKNETSDAFKLNPRGTEVQESLNKVKDSNIQAVEQPEESKKEKGSLVKQNGSIKEKSSSVEQQRKNQITNHRFHIVRRGENTYRIALRYGLTLDELCALNNMMPKDIVRPGQKLVVHKR